METTAPGGINKVVSEIGEHLTKWGHEVTVLQPNPLNLQSQELFRNFHIVRHNSAVGRIFHELDPRLHFSLRAILSQTTPDIVHVHGYGTLFSFEILQLLKGENYPIVYSPHFDIESHNSFAGRHLWAIFNRYVGNSNFKIADKILCASKFESENVKGIFGVNEKRVEIVAHGVDHIHITPRNKKDHIDLVYFGYLFELKGVQYILYAVNRLKNKLGVDVILTIIGEGNYKPHLQALAKKMKIEDSIKWFSFLTEDELREKLEAADIFLLLSRSENYGIAVAEALSMGIPCVVAKTTALREFLDEPGCFGIDYPPDQNELAQLIVKVHNNTKKTGHLTDKIRTWDEIARHYERIYVQTIGKHF